ncbi:uncharacterized [Tachysurus ichikawai]
MTSIQRRAKSSSFTSFIFTTNVLRCSDGNDGTRDVEVSDPSWMSYLYDKTPEVVLLQENKPGRDGVEIVCVIIGTPLSIILPQQIFIPATVMLDTTLIHYRLR